MATEQGKLAVGFIGLGLMGGPMAKNVLKAGYPLRIWNRSLARTEELRQMGAQLASNPKELAEKSNVVITMVAGPQAVRDVLLGTVSWPGVIEGIRPGTVVVDMATNLPSVSVGLADEVRKKGGEMLDAPVAGSVKPAAEGTLTILVGGKKEALDKVRPILETIGKKIHHVGGNGMGCTMKLFLNSHLFGMLTSFVESLTLGRKAGLDTAMMLKVLGDTVFKSYVSDLRGPKILAGDYSPLFTLELMSKDIELALELSKNLKMAVPLLDVAKDVTYTAMTQGKGKLDHCAIALVYEQMADVKFTAAADKG